MLLVEAELTEVYDDCVYIAALDISFTNTGIIIIEWCEDGGDFEIVFADVINTARESKKRGTYVVDDDLRRIREISLNLHEVLRHYNVQLLLTEFPYNAGQGKLAAQGMGISKGIVAAIAGGLDVQIENFLPHDTKKTMTGKKSASKEEMTNAAAKCYPELFSNEAFHSTRSASGWVGYVEHIGDAIAIFETAKVSSKMLSMLLRSRR